MRYIIYDAKHKQVVCDTENYGYALSDVTRYLTFHEDVNWTDLHPVEIIETYNNDNSMVWSVLHSAHETHKMVDLLLYAKKACGD